MSWWVQSYRSEKETNASNIEDESDRPQNANEVTIRGGKKGANAAKAEILELLDYEVENGHSITFTVQQRAIAQIVGRAGATINELKDETNTRIDIDRSTKEGSDPASAVGITIVGRKADVEKARKAIIAILCGNSMRNAGRKWRKYNRKQRDFMQKTK